VINVNRQAQACFGVLPRAPFFGLVELFALFGSPSDLRFFDSSPLPSVRAVRQCTAWLRRYLPIHSTIPDAVNELMTSQGESIVACHPHSSATQFSRRNPGAISTFPRRASLRSPESTVPLQRSGMTKRLAVIALAPLVAVSLLAQQPPPPEQSQPPQGQVQGRGQGGGPGAAGGGRRGAAPQRDVAAPTGTGAITGRVVAAENRESAAPRSGGRGWRRPSSRREHR
jgi:hypothetical protein